MSIISMLDQWDKNLFLFLNGFHNTLWDYVMTLFTLTPVWIPFYLVILAIIIRRYRKESLWIIFAVVLLILFSDQFAGILKHSVKRLRPSHDPEISQLAHIFFTKGGLYSFVSAHAANSFAFATFFILLFRNSIFTFFIIAWSVMIAYTRIYLGVHYPGDVLGGIILGILTGTGIYKLLLLYERKYRHEKSFQTNRLALKEARTIIFVGLLTIVLCLEIVGLLMNSQLLNINF